MNLRELAEQQPVIVWAMPGGWLDFGPVLRIPVPNPVPNPVVPGDVLHVKFEPFGVNVGTATLEYDVVGRRADGLLKLRRR